MPVAVQVYVPVRDQEDAQGLLVECNWLPVGRTEGAGVSGVEQHGNLQNALALRSPSR